MKSNKINLQKLLAIVVALLGVIGVSLVVGEPFKGGTASAHQVTEYRVVFEINDPAGTGNANWVGALNNINNSLNELGEERMEVEVVVHGAGIHLLNKEKSPAELQQRIAQLQQRGVVFAACANSMAKNGYTMADMIDGAVQVPSGAAEVIKKQKMGWIYMHS